MPSQIAQFAGSLAAVILLVLVAARLRLGGDARIAGDEEARELADSVLCGYEPVAIALDRHGRGALLSDGDGRLMLLAPHGNRFVGRLLDRRARATLDERRLVVSTGERTLKPAALELADAAAWCRAIEALD